MAIHSSILAWSIHWTDKPCRLQSEGPHTNGHNWSSLAHSRFTMCYFQMYSKVIQLYTHIHSHKRTHTYVAYQALWSMGFSRQEYWSGLPSHNFFSMWFFKTLVGSWFIVTFMCQLPQQNKDLSKYNCQICFSLLPWFFVSISHLKVLLRGCL